MKTNNAIQCNFKTLSVGLRNIENECRCSLIARIKIIVRNHLEARGRAPNDDDSDLLRPLVTSGIIMIGGALGVRECD
jgi:hypothetical protein